MSYLPQMPLPPFGLSLSKPGLAAYVQGFDKPVLSLPKGSARTGGGRRRLRQVDNQVFLASSALSISASSY